MPDEITLTIDGREVTVPEGTNVADAARSVGINIPVFCYHPRMQPVGMCRMCLVVVGMPRIDRASGQPVLDEEGKPVIGMLPKLQTACTTLVSKGMVVITNSKEVKFAQRGILEFLLTSHPLDCPVCDKGGECPLQDLTMEWGPSESRFDYHNKQHQQKPVPLGDLILLDRERCILCGRCVRFQDELADDPVLGFDNRGRAWCIISKSDPPFDSKYSGNTTDICPVGALTTADFRFRARVWEVRPVPSLCLHCSVGCNITLDMRHDTVMRVMPRENSAVNDLWICDKGRFGQRFFESDERLTKPLIRRGNDFEEVSWEQAIQAISERFASLHRTYGGDVLAGLAGEHLSNEDAYLFQRLFREVLGSNNLDHRVGSHGEPHDDTVGVTCGVGSGTNLMSLGAGTTVLVLGADPEEEAPLYMLRLREIARRGGELIVANVRPTKLDRSATMRLRYAPGTESQLVRGLLRIVLEEAGPQHLTQRTTGLADLRAVLNISLGTIARATGIEEDRIRAAARSLLQARNGIIVYGSDALALGPMLTQDLGSLAMLSGKVGRANNGLIPLLPRGNSRGVLDMGVCAERGPGYAPLVPQQPGKTSGERRERGLSAREMWNAAVEGRLHGLYLAGVDPVGRYPATQTALERLDMLVVQDMFLTPTARLAHVVLPTAAFAERDGTYTNAERRVQRARQARQVVGESRPDWAIVQDIALALIEMGVGGAEQQRKQSAQERETQSRRKKGTKGSARPAGSYQDSWGYLTASDVALDIAKNVPGYQGITHASLARTGQSGTWGRQPTESLYFDGTSYENTEGVGIQYPAPTERPDAPLSLTPRGTETLPSDQRYPFLLQPQRLLYDDDPMLSGSLLHAHIPEPYVGINTADAQELGIISGETVRVASATGSLDLTARVADNIPRKSVLIPSYLPGALLASIQTGPRTRVALSKP
jgi:NADH-quinone oxidoreductase subunit G